jgi:hypothetical protein
VKHPGILLMPRPELEVRELAIPPVGESEVAGLISYKLRSIYPGSPEDTAFDYRLQRPGSGGTRRAHVFIARKSMVERHRAEAGDRVLALPLTLLLPLAPKRGDLRAWVLGDGWAEHLSFHDGELVSSTLIKGAGAFDLGVAEARLPEGVAIGSPQIVAAEAALDGLDLPADVARVSLESLSRRLRRSDGLFTESPRTPRTPPGVRYAVLVSAIVLLGLLLLLKQVVTVERHANALRDVSLSLEKSGQNVLALQKEIATLSAEQKLLESREPRDVYLLLSELAAVLGDGVRIQSISVQDTGFQVDAIGSNALVLMEGFKSREHFRNVKLSQVVPDAKSGRERFSFSGTFDGH